MMFKCKIWERFYCGQCHCNWFNQIELTKSTQSNGRVAELNTINPLIQLPFRLNHSSSFVKRVSSPYFQKAPSDDLPHRHSTSLIHFLVNWQSSQVGAKTYKLPVINSHSSIILLKAFWLAAAKLTDPTKKSFFLAGEFFGEQQKKCLVGI